MDIEAAVKITMEVHGHEKWAIHGYDGLLTLKRAEQVGAVFLSEQPIVGKLYSNLIRSVPKKDRVPLDLLHRQKPPHLSSLGYFSNLYVGFIKIFLELGQGFLCRLERASPSRWISFEMSAELPDRFLRMSTDISNRNRSAFRQSLDFVLHDWTASVFNTIPRAGNWFETQNGLHNFLQVGRIP
jgi:hypothetical protein